MVRSSRFMKAKSSAKSSRREPPRLEGLRLLERQGDRARFLLDREVAGRLDFAAAGIEVIGEMPLTLEELYLALVQK